MISARGVTPSLEVNAGSGENMGFADAFKKSTGPHVDSPAQAKARAEAAEEVKSKADAKVAKAAEKRAGKKAEAPKK
ncbi:MAG: hypothetical protein ACJ79R_13485 [Anaeromyxobacteraceae bacterium]